MKKQLLLILAGMIFLALLVTESSCNDGKDALACSVIVWSELSADQRTTLQNAGFDVGSTISWPELNADQRQAFLTAGLDSMQCYNVNP